MSVQDPPLLPHWQYYSDRAHEAHVGRADDFGLGREEQLWETLHAIQRGEPFTDVCRHRLDRLPQNRAKKYRRLLRRLASMAPELPGEHTSPVELADTLANVRRAMTDTEWQVEYRLASGQTYAEIAPEFEITTDALKVRVSRWRERLRRKLAW